MEEGRLDLRPRGCFQTTSIWVAFGCTPVASSQGQGRGCRVEPCGRGQRAWGPCPLWSGGTVPNPASPLALPRTQATWQNHKPGGSRGQSLVKGPWGLWPCGQGTVQTLGYCP